MGIVTVDKLENADKDADSLNTFINGSDTAKVKTRTNKEYPTLANAVKQVIETGGFEPFATESALLASRPSITKKAAKALDTKKVWLWDGAQWNDTGLSEYDLANQYTDSTTIKKKKIDDTDDILVSITDQNLNRTWLEANSEDGGLSDHSKKMLEKKLNVKFSEIESVKYFFALLDRSGNLTDLTLNENGQFADFVLDRLSNRLNISNTEPNKAYYFNELYNKTYPFESTNKILATWGSSSIDRSSDYILAICKQMGIEFIDGGVGGEDIDQTRERMGEGLQEITFKDGTIPRFNNEVEINVKTNMHYLGDYDGWINVDGQIVSGRIDYRTATAKHYFKRLDTNGVETTTVNTAAYPFTPLGIEKHKIATTILWAGKNNLSRSEVSNPKNSVAYCLEKTKDMYNFLTPLAKRCLVISHFVDTNSSVEAAAKVLNCNSILKEQYGDVYLDIQEWMCSPQMWVDTGITPTEADLIAQTEGKKPSSVSSDSGHFTPEVYNVIVNKVIFPKLQKLGWF